MDIETLMKIYIKEREYQKNCFGEYKDMNSLNFASFLNFIRQYLNKSEKAYAEKWDSELPGWLVMCDEMHEGTGPADAYEQLIKLFALAGAALETYTELDPEKWRANPDEGKKWK